MGFQFPKSLQPYLETVTKKVAQVQGLNLPEPSRTSLEHKLRIELTHGSTAIEGNTLTLRETQLLIDEGITPTSSKELRELHEVSNHDTALKKVQLWVSDAKPITTESICLIHGIVLKNIEDETAGRFRTARVMVTGAPRQPIRPELISEKIEELVSDIQSTGKHPVAIAAEAHYRFVKIHPFFDGNGRTGRLLMNWILLKKGYPMTVISGDERARYINAIDEADRENPADFCQLICECVDRSLDQYLEMG